MKNIRCYFTLGALILITYSSSVLCMQGSDNYSIKEGYRARTAYAHHDDTSFEDEYQDEVYQMARELADSEGYTKIIDIGCGSGFKLLKYFKHLNFTGFEIEPTLSWLKREYPEHSWESSDFSKSISEAADIVICCDVIEHLLDPDELLAWIKKIDSKVIILSTPDRGVLVKERRVKENGPPANPFHIREWNFKEFENYISKWFDIVDHRCMNKQTECQVVVCKKRAE